MKSARKIVHTAIFSALMAGAGPSIAADYFGYFAISMAGTGDNQAAVADHSNVVWIHNQPNMTEIINSINAATASGKKVILSLTPLFQLSNGNFNPNWSISWSSWVAALAPYSNSIVAFYPMDEPSSDKVSMANATTMVNAIHSAFPGKPVAAIYAYKADSNMSLFDWVGIDCYGNGTFSCSGTEYTYRYADMRQALGANQRTILVPQASMKTSNDGCCIDALKQEAKRFNQLAYGDSKVIGIFPFIWEDIYGWYGLNHYPTLQPVWKQIGAEITTHWSYPSGVLPMYRFFSTTTYDYFFTKNIAEGINVARANHFTFEGIGFAIYSTQLSGTYPLYRCKTPTSHFISVSSTCETFTSEGIYGYAYPTQVTGTTPLYRFVNPGNWTHLETTNYSEGTSKGLTYEGLLGYVPNTTMPSVGC